MELHVRVGKEASEEGRRPRAILAPGIPTQEEDDHHNLTEIPFRTWFPSRVLGRARGRPRRRRAWQGAKTPKR